MTLSRIESRVNDIKRRLSIGVGVLAPAENCMYRLVYSIGGAAREIECKTKGEGIEKFHRISSKDVPLIIIDL